MSITFKAFTTMLAEGKRAYSSESEWRTAAEAAGFDVKKLSGESASGDQTWGAFDSDEKVGEFGEKDGSGWLAEARVDELFGIFRNNEKIKADREKLKKDTAAMVDQHRARQSAKQNAQQAQRNGRGEGEEVDPDEEEEEEDRRKKTTSQTRSASTRGTRTTQSAAQGRAAERDWVKNM